MLSDAIREARMMLDEFAHGGLAASPEGVTAQIAVFRAWEIEARNMEERIAFLGGRAAPLMPADALRLPGMRPGGHGGTQPRHPGGSAA